MKAPTAKQMAVLDFIRSFVVEHAYPPTMREINTHFGWSSTNAAATHLAALERRGLVVRDPEKSRSLRIVQSEAEKLSPPEAGKPSGVDRALKIEGAVLLIKAARRSYFRVGPELSAANEPLFLADVRRILEETLW